MDGPHRGQVFQRHLRRAVLPDVDPGVGAAQADVGAADSGHAHEVVGPAQEGRESRREGNPLQDLETHGGGEHLLLGDVHLEEALRMGLLELLRVGGVAHLSVQRHHVAARRSHSREGVAEGLARRHLRPRLVAR